MSKPEVVEVESAGQLKQFITYPNRLYRDDPNYVVPLLAERREFFDFRKNPFYRVAKVKLFLAMRDGEVVGRIATCVNFRHNEFHDERTGFFGFFDCPDDPEVSAVLLKVAMITLKKEGMERMRGPMNFSTNHEVGFLVEGFDVPPTVMMNYNHAYQPRLAEKFGLKKAMDLLTYCIDKEMPIPERQVRVVERFRKRSKINLRTLRMREFDQEVERFRDIYNSAWAPNWGFVPMDEAEFRYTAKNLKQIVDPDLVFIAEHEGKSVAFSLALPNVNQALIKLNGRLFPLGILKLLWHTKIRNTVNTLRMITFGIMPEYQRKGIDAMLYFATVNRAIEKGYQWAELSWILESNELMLRAAEGMGARRTKRYRVMEMPL
jgi:GNAT superfamily N-acetyltransferase